MNRRQVNLQLLSIYLFLLAWVRLTPSVDGRSESGSTCSSLWATDAANKKVAPQEEFLNVGTLSIAGAMLTIIGRGGTRGTDNENDENNSESAPDNDNDESRYLPSQSTTRPRRSSGAGRVSSSLPKSVQSTSSIVQNIAQQSMKLTTKAVWATARQSGRAAYYLTQPKHVERNELLGLWRFDQQIYRLGAGPQFQDNTLLACVATIEVADQSVIVRDKSSTMSSSRLNEQSSPWKFIPSVWPRTARIEFMARAFVLVNDEDDDLNHPSQRSSPPLLLYKGQVLRKWAARSVLKIRGKIYQLERIGWGGRTVREIEIGTFIARRRIQLDEATSESDDGGEDDDDDEVEMDEIDSNTNDDENDEDNNEMEDDENETIKK